MTSQAGMADRHEADVSATDVDATAEALRAELEGLVRIAARRPDLTVREGHPGCPWSFAWGAGVVTVNPEQLRAFAPDLCRGLALHEAAHAAVTVLQDIVPPSLFDRIQPLLNTLEDIRIEVWMRSRFPGAAPWIRAYNDVIYGHNRGRSPPRSRQVQFLLGILECWWYGTPAPATLPEVCAALDECRGAISAATGFQPPLDDDAGAILSSQRAMWDVVRRHILPTWNRLVALDRREGIGRMAAHELDSFAQATGGGGEGAGRHRCVRRRRGRRREVIREVPDRAARRHAERARRAAAAAAGCGGGGSPDERPADGSGRSGSPASPRTEQAQAGRAASEPAGGGADRYLDAWRRIGATVDRLGDELLRLLVPRQRLRWSPGHPWGPRLELRRAMQFEADPQHYRRLWSRPILPHRRDPAVLLLVDRSSSMTQGDCIGRALEGTVLLAEVCRRIGVPAAVWSFANAARKELDWDDPVDVRARHRLGSLPDCCHGSTAMAAALALVGREFAARRGDPKLLFVIGDGAPDQHDATLAAVRRLEDEGVISVGLGLGPGTAGLARYFQNSVTEIPPEQLVDHLADLLGEALLTSA